MKRLTLEFKSIALEKKYQRYIQLIYAPQVTKLLNSFIVLIIIPCLIMGLVKKIYLDVVLYCIEGTLILSIKYIIKRYGQFYNIILSILLIGIQVLMSYKLYDQGAFLGQDDKFILFFYGANLIQIQSSIQNLSQSFWLSVLTIATQNAMQYHNHFFDLMKNPNYIRDYLISFFNLKVEVYIFFFNINRFLTLTWDTSIYEFKFTYIIFNGFTIYFMYQHLKDKKEVFMLRENEKQWVKIVKNGLSQQIITVKYNQKINVISLDIVNKNALQKFKIFNENDFKTFSRKLKVFTQIQEVYTDLQSKRFIQGHETNKGVTLENQIIEFMKSTIQENDQRVDEILQNDATPSIQRNIRAQQLYFTKHRKSFNQNRVAQYYTQIESADEPHKLQRYRIKMSYFQSQTTHQCCIVFDQESDQQKVKNLEEAKRKLQNNFIHICVQLGQYIQMVQQSLNFIERSRSYLYLTLNKLQNVCDHHFYISRNCNSRSKIKVGSIVTTSLGDLSDKLKEIFWDQKTKLAVKYVNCSVDSQICTNFKKIQQILVNFVQNSLKLEIEDNLKQITQNQSKCLDISSTPQKLLTTNYSFNDTIQEQQTAIFDSNTVRNSKQSSICNQKCKRLNKNTHITIQFQVIEGENDQSNVLKVQIKDNCVGMSTESLLEVLKSISYQNSQENYDYAFFCNLGWKVSCHTIGQLGPYSDFFVSPKSQQGLKICFFVYMNMKIIDEQTNSTTFQNKEFFKIYEKLQKKYFHKNTKANSNFKFLMSAKSQEIHEEQQSNSEYYSTSENHDISNISHSITENAIINGIYSFSNYQNKEFQSTKCSKEIQNSRNLFMPINQIQQSESIKILPQYI